jgi:predicted RNase H-like HicB family nuclease
MKGIVGHATDGRDGGIMKREPTMNEVTIRLHIESLEDGKYLATSPDVPGLVAEGRSITEAAEIAQGLTRKIVESCLEHGDPLPPALTQLADPGGAVELRIPVGIA